MYREIVLNNNIDFYVIARKVLLLALPMQDIDMKSTNEGLLPYELENLRGCHPTLAIDQDKDITVVLLERSRPEGDLK